MAVYAADRGGDMQLMPSRLAIARPLFGALAGNLPSFLHAFAFCLLLGRRWVPAWCLAEAAFELLQARPVAALLPDAWPALTRFARSGTFDPLDLAAVAAGGLAALWLMSTNSNLGGMNETRGAGISPGSDIGGRRVHDRRLAQEGRRGTQ